MRLKLILGLTGLFIAVAFVAATATWLLPPDYLLSKERTFVFGFLASLFVAGISGVAAHLSRRLVDRPVVRIEHVDFKSERIPFRLDSTIWWRLTHSGIVDFIDKRVNWPVSNFEKNEFAYHQLPDLSEIIDQRINTYKGTADWARTLIDHIKKYGSCASDDLRNEILANLSPDIVKFEEHYRETRKASLFKDLAEKPKEVADFMVSEAQGLLVAHDSELSTYQQFKEWIETNLAEGEAAPKQPDHKTKVVPNVNIVVGATNVGRTPALIRLDAICRFGEQNVPIKITQKSATLFFKIDANQVAPLLFEIDKNKCSFELARSLYEALTIGNKISKVTLILFLADGQKIQKRRIKLQDNSALPI